MTDVPFLRLVHDKLGEGVEEVGEPMAVVSIILGNDEDYSVKVVKDHQVRIWDVFSRVGWIAKRERKDLVG